MVHRPTTVLGEKYTIVRLLGAGGHGHTYEATTPEGTAVAIKVLSLRGLSDWKAFELFEREARVLQGLDHPMVPKYIDDLSLEGPDGPTFCIVQQLAPGRTLQALVEGGWRCGEADIRDMASRLLHALQYLHTRTPPVIHRDLKPANILRDDAGNLSIVDFGAVRDRIYTTVSGGSTMVGTFGYMAPEQMRGQALPTTDLYGLGATLVFLLTGHNPSDLPSSRLRIDYRGHVSVSDPFAAWLDQMIAPAPEERFASAAAALDALRRPAAMIPVPASPRPARSGAGVALAVGVGALLVSGGTIAALLTRSESEPPVASSEVSTPPAAPEPSVAPPEPPPPPPPAPPEQPEKAQWWPEPTSPSLGGPLDVQWALEIGITTYRSTIHATDGRIVVNSNGATPANLPDVRDGVYVIGFDGTTLQHIVPPGDGETDSNGVALSEAGIYFGTDQDAFYHFDWSGTLRWQQALDGDPEAPPALADFNGDGILDAAVSSEAGTLYLLDGQNGTIAHQIHAGTGEYGQTGFAGPPAVYDVNGDGTADVLVPARDQLFRAIDGATGETLWTRKGGSGMHGAPILVDLGFGDPEPELVFTEAYSVVTAVDPASGAPHWSVELEHPGMGIEGLFGPIGYDPDANCVLVGTAWWKEQEGVYCLDAKNGRKRWRAKEARENITSGFVIGDVDGKPGNEVVFGTEAGFLVALNSRGKEVFRQGLGGPVECTPTLADLDGDGTTDVLVAANDGKLYALSTKGEAGTLTTAGSYVRFDGRNTGVRPR